MLYSIPQRKTVQYNSVSANGVLHDKSSPTRGVIPLLSSVSGFFVPHLLLFCYSSNRNVAFQTHYHCCFSALPKWSNSEIEHHASISLIITFSKETGFKFMLIMKVLFVYSYTGKSFFLSFSFFLLLTFFFNTVCAFQVTENGTECSELCALLSGTVLFTCTDFAFVKK